jgi:hypothetical protein
MYIQHMYLQEYVSVSGSCEEGEPGRLFMPSGRKGELTQPASCGWGGVCSGSRAAAGGSRRAPIGPLKKGGNLGGERE